MKTCSIDTKGEIKPISKDVKKDFPLFSANPDLIYFDNASTSQKPQVVLDVIDNYLKKHCANAGRAAYSWSTQLEKGIEETRKKIADFIVCDPAQVVFTSGATDSLNLVVQSWALANLQDGDEILLCPQDHKSAVLPWYQVKETLNGFGKNIVIKHFAIHEVGDYDLKSIKALVSERTRVLAMAHIHHVYGLDMEVGEIREMVGPDCIISLDASQSVGHAAVDASTLPVDFISFSGHKMLAGPGTGVLYVHPRLNSQLKPVRLGGKSPAEIKDGRLVLDATNPSNLLECGTQNIPGILSLGAAIDYINGIGLASIERHVSDLTVYLWKRLKDLPGIDFAPGIGICACEHGFGIIAFRFSQLTSMDLSFALDGERIFVRTGDHCIYGGDKEEEKQDDYLRVSMHLYNTKEEVDTFVEVLEGCLS